MTATCEHVAFQASVAINRLADTGCFSADIRVRCATCGEPFRFLGVEPGASYEGPRVSIDGLELRAPIEPQGEPRLFTRATFQMPPRSGERES